MNQYNSQVVKVIKIIEGENPQHLAISNLKGNKLSSSRIPHKVWDSNLVNLVALLDDLEIDYVLMKYVSLQYAVMKDIDLLIENTADVKKLVARLSQMKFEIHDKGVRRSDKATALGNFIANSKTEIDIYVSPCWWMIKYAPVGFISSSKIKRKICGKTVNLPCPAHSIFMIATHSYWHGCITLSEIAQIGKTIMTEQIIWSDLLSLAKDYHLEHPLYLNLSFVNDIFKLANRQNVELQNAVNELQKLNISNLLRAAVLNANEEFPLHIPYKFKITSALDEIFQGLIKKRVTYQEFESYFYASLLGRRVHF
jgi:hypothetical protein